jgi:circadian clock protein KaiB
MPKTRPRTLRDAPSGRAADEAPDYQLRLYVADQTPNSAAALATLRRICETHLAGRAALEVIDLLANPELAARDQIVAVPTLVCRRPMPAVKLVGGLANEARVLAGLELGPNG